MRSASAVPGSFGFAATTIPVVENSDTGAKSRTTSYGSFLYSVAFTACVPLLPTQIVEPSAAACAQSSLATTPLLLGRLSTTSVCPSASLIFGTTSRACTSEGPPGGETTSTRMGRWLCAVAWPDKAATLIATRTTRTFVFIPGHPLFITSAQ
jgi:hypothetical protein